MMCCVSQAVGLCITNVNLAVAQAPHKQMWTAGYYKWTVIRDLTLAAPKFSAVRIVIDVARVCGNICF